MDKNEAVSYTHLDVYKRQDITKAIKELRKDETLTSSYEIIGIVSSVLVRDGFKEVLKACLLYTSRCV